MPRKTKVELLEEADGLGLEFSDDDHYLDILNAVKEARATAEEDPEEEAPRTAGPEDRPGPPDEPGKFVPPLHAPAKRDPEPRRTKSVGRRATEEGFPLTEEELAELTDEERVALEQENAPAEPPRRWNSLGQRNRRR